MNTNIQSLRMLSESQYINIGRTNHLLSNIEYELFRTLSAAIGDTEIDKIRTAARGTFRQRLSDLRDKLGCDTRIQPDELRRTIDKLETASELRDQFFHGLWVEQEGQLISKFIKRYKGADGQNGAAPQTIVMTPDKFARIHRNLGYILVELDVIQEILLNA